MPNTNHHIRALTLLDSVMESQTLRFSSSLHSVSVLATKQVFSSVDYYFHTVVEVLSAVRTQVPSSRLNPFIQLLHQREVVNETLCLELEYFLEIAKIIAGPLEVGPTSLPGAFTQYMRYVVNKLHPKARTFRSMHFAP